MPRKERISKEEIEVLRRQLLERRHDLIEYRTRLGDSWANLHAPEIEFEEMAQKEVIAQGMDQLDDQERKEFQSIDLALRKIETGTYGICENCGRPIRFERLQALPWTQYCNDCAGGAEIPSAPPAMIEEEAEAEASSLPSEYQGLSDDQIEEVIWDELREDGRVDLQELEISSQDGVIYLEGALPSQEERHILIEIIEDNLGFREVIDHLLINHALWEREDRAEGREVEETTPKEVAMEGEGDDEESMDEARRSGLEVSPPDELVPENEQ
ncbi:MAG: TraR/DksA C4-type zinc finger protein [Desulfobacteraceae bacterium]|nr:TraR/DksA C4-type zinc finger protein [Desulfobacteraceae bacterium]